jgi:hypothetical protein
MLLAAIGYPTARPNQGATDSSYVVITATGGGFFGNPVTDDSILAFALDSK